MRVRANSIYRFTADYFMDRAASFTDGTPLRVGDLVKVVNLYGCPPANTMGQCYVELVGMPAPKSNNPNARKPFCMIATSSLEKV